LSTSLVEDFYTTVTLSEEGTELRLDQSNPWIRQGAQVNRLEKLESDVISGECSLSGFCSEIASMFRVRTHEVAILELNKAVLQFVYPPELRKTGLIPLISSAQVAKTAMSKRAEIFNNFTSVRHSSIFETVRFSGESSLTIQRLMSAPISGPNGNVVGVIQISRKGNTPMDSGPEFDQADLHELREIANSIGRVAGELFNHDAKIPDAPATAAPQEALGAEAK
jgi:hypothetical protein